MKQCKMIAMVVLVCLLTGCQLEKIDGSKKKNIDFTVVSELEMTEPVKQIIAEKKTAPFKLTFSDEQFTYLLIGYGKQNTGGYSIKVKELYESKNAVYVKTEFAGPRQYEEQSHESYPYIVIKIEYTDKNVIFSE